MQGIRLLALLSAFALGSHAVAGDDGFEGKSPFEQLREQRGEEAATAEREGLRHTEDARPGGGYGQTYDESDGTLWQQPDRSSGSPGQEVNTFRSGDDLGEGGRSPQVEPNAEGADTDDPAGREL